MGPPIIVAQSAYDKGRHLSREAKFTMLWPEKAEKSADSKGSLSINEKRQKCERGVFLEGSGAHSVWLDFAEFINSEWSPDQHAPMKHSKSALRSREGMLGS